MRILLWEDWWFVNGPLKDETWVFPFCELCIHSFGRYVANYIVDGSWKRLHDINLGLEVLCKALSLVHILAFSPTYKVVWKLSSSGNFFNFFGVL